MTTKCKRCVARWTCRSCGAKTCEHFCGSKNVTTHEATCAACRKKA